MAYFPYKTITYQGTACKDKLRQQSILQTLKRALSQKSPLDK